MISTMRPSILAILRLALGFAMMAAFFPDWILAAPVSSYKIVAEFPHSVDSYTEGFFYRNGFFYEGTGAERQLHNPCHRLADWQSLSTTQSGAAILR
jgi:glutamine cyclotransferase